MTRWQKLAVIWLGLLVASNGWRLSTSPDGPLPTHKQARFVQLGDNQPAARIAYIDSGPESARPVVILLHGSPASGSLDMLVPTLQQSYRVIAPDLPGFGHSSLRVPDYSIAAHARYVLALMDELDVPHAHLVAYSMGGGVALEMYRQAPTRVASATMISAIGVQELELFGRFELNHAVHGLQLVLLTALEWGIPHFGYLDDALLNRTYARNFFDSDQRPLRAVLQAFEPPMLIVHGRSDGLVPRAVAQEHHRIVPHSELVELDGGHGLIFYRGGELGGLAGRFITRVEDGTAASRAGADPGRLSDAARPFDWQQARRFAGMGLIVMLLLLALATWVSEDLACISAGLLVAQGVLPFWPATLACIAGIFSGDLLLYFAGKHLGRPVMRRAPVRWFVGGAGVDAARQWFERRGPVVILTSRFVPGTRLPTYLAAGALGTPLATFSLWFLIAAFLWTPLLVAAAALAGLAARDLFDRFSDVALPAVLLLALVLLIVLRLVVPLFSARGRRLLLSRWRRISRWEFWPPWAFYPPVVAYVLWLGVRYRGLTLFTASNPAIPAGGFVGESKYDILLALGDAGGYVAATALLPDGDTRNRARHVQAFMRAERLDFPIVLKPDVGERGSEVCIARNDDDVRRYLEVHPAPTLVQAFAPGHEFGVFYVRYPGEEKGFVFAITDKRPPGVIGDGRRSLEQLILDDDRGVCMAPTFLDRHAERLFEVPAPGENVPLVEIGTHCRGCVFLDGEWVRTAAMEAAIDRISRGFDGFYFGRYDLRTPSIEDFRRGENFRIVELNGVTSEATNIYDPGNGLWNAYRTLFAQWRHAFEIGARNRARGVQPVTVLELLAIVRRNNHQKRRSVEASTA